MKGESSARFAIRPFAVRPVAAVVAVVVAVLTVLSGRYGFHRDELYFLDAGDHPAWGYVDQPPLTPIVTRLTSSVLGETPMGLRVAATLAAAATVVVVVLIARETGAGHRGQLIAACSAAVSAFVLVLGHMVATATFDMLAWLTICWLALRLLRTGNARWWLPLGVAIGIGLLNKYLVALLLGALLVALAGTGPRRVLRTPWLLVGAAVAFVIVLPNLWWQATHGWPQLTVAGGISADDGAENRALFVPLQIVQLSPVLVPIWIAGFVRLWREPGLRWARSVALAYPICCVLILLVGGKPYYALPLLLVLVATGAESVAQWTLRGRAAVRRGVLVAGLALGGAISAVVALPVLPPSGLTVVNAMNQEQGEQVGWRELVRAVAAGWSRIPEGQRDRAVIFTQNYGQAGAVALYGPEHGLPRPYSGHMSYADWGPPPDEADGPVLLVVQEGTRSTDPFTDCREVARVDNGEAVDNEEQGAAVLVCAGPPRSWSTLWPDLRHFY